MNKFRTEKLLHAGAAALIALALTSVASADDYPSKAIRLVVPFPAGGGIDATARMIAQSLGEGLKQSVVIDNRPGANGMIGTDIVAKAPPDGYTLLLVDRGALGINPSLYKKLPYDANKDFDYLGIAVWSPYVLIANPKVPAATFPELVQYAKKNPGKVNYASFGNGSMPQFGMESLNSQFGISTTHVPYKGGAPAMTATLAGEVDVTLSSLGLVLGGIRDGRLKGLVIGAAKRSPLLPQVAAITEVGGSENTVPSTYFGFAFPAGTPKAISQRLITEIRRVLAMPDVIDRMTRGGFEAGKMSPEDMVATVRQDVVNFGKQAASLGIQPE